VAALQAGQPAEVGQALALLLGHVVAVGQVGRADRGEPGVAADRVPRHLGDRVPDLVVVVDGVEGLSLDPGGAARGQAHPQQLRIEDLLLRGRVQLEERRKPGPQRGQHLGLGAADLLQDRELPALLVVVVEDQLGDVHGPSRGRRRVQVPTITHRSPARYRSSSLAITSCWIWLVPS
jgi:hypothetical protein